MNGTLRSPAPDRRSLAEQEQTEVPDGVTIDLADLIDRHQAHIWRYLRALGCPADEAEDLTQETFLRVVRKPFRNLGHHAAVSYLRRVAYHCLVHNRRQKQLPVSEVDVAEIDETWTRWHAGGRDDLLEVVAACVRDLPERSRRSLELRFRDGLSRKQIAALLELTESGAKNLLQRAKDTLRDRIERRLAQEDRPGGAVA